MVMYYLLLALERENPLNGFWILVILIIYVLIGTGFQPICLLNLVLSLWAMTPNVMDRYCGDQDP